MKLLLNSVGKLTEDVIFLHNIASPHVAYIDQD